jgi:hypothetical protein
MTFHFDAATHTYLLGGRALPSVTQVLKHAGLVSYAHIPQDVLARASHRGKWVHAKCQAIDDGLDLPGMPEEYQPWVDAYLKFKRETGFILELNEYRSFHKHFRYAGTMDRTGILSHLSRSRWLIDFKTGIYLPGHRFQLAAYAALLREPRRYKRAILQLCGDGSYKLHPHPNGDFDRDFGVFRSALHEMRKDVAA